MGSTYFVRRDKYWRYNHNTGALDRGFPRNFHADWLGCGGRRRMRLMSGPTNSTSNSHNGTPVTYEVLRLTPSHNEHRQWLRELEHNLGDMLDFWSDVKQIDGSTVDIMVPPAIQADIRDTLAAKGLEFTVMTGDVGAALASQERQRVQRRASQPSTQALSDFDYTVYHTYDEIQQWVNDVVAEYPSLVTRFELPSKSYEGRVISGLKISSGGGGSKPAVYFEGGIHAREWISPATVMYMTANLLSDYISGVPDVQDLINKLDWYIVPSLNVDGYVYTWTDDRLWRKTRSSNVQDTGSGCTGTDPNRNWPYEWGGEGTSAFPCSNVYRGNEPLSEQEVEAVVDFLREIKAGGQDFIWFIDWHSYSQLIISPWSFSAEVDDPEDMTDQLNAGDAMVNAILATHGKTYTAGPTAKLLYAAAGASNDWGYVPYVDGNDKTLGGLGAKYSYVVELRDTGDYGFLLPEDQILPTAEENYAGMIAMAHFIIANEAI
ncbi:carboxypeptidase B-like [Diadema setosum]|uniref:carboxypeptidase B-like n=1 Tax=Diadema setosum TaxID=31175 RepID=UPI003B3B93DA